MSDSSTEVVANTGDNTMIIIAIVTSVIVVAIVAITAVIIINRNKKD